MNFEKESEKLNKKFLEACERNNLDLVTTLYNKYYLEHYSLKNRFLRLIKLYKPKTPILDIHFQNNSPILHAFDYGNTSISNFLLEDKLFYLSLSKDSDELIRVSSRMLKSSIQKNDIESVKRLLPLIKNKNDIFYENVTDALSWIFRNNEIDLIKYILKQPDIDNQKLELYQDEFNTISSYSLRFKLFKNSCSSGNLELIKFLTSSELNSKIDVNFINDDIFVKNTDVINYLVFDLNINKDIFFKYFHSLSAELKEYMSSACDKRALNDELTINLKENNNKETNKRIKI